ncbi:MULTISPECIES: hypothetical protein [unclassified Rickettsia]
MSFLFKACLRGYQIVIANERSECGNLGNNDEIASSLREELQSNKGEARK